MATKYANGQVSISALVQIRDRAGSLEPYHWSSPYAARQWYLLRDWVYDTYGVTLHITPGKNAYRDLDGQHTAKLAACAAGNCRGAADEGTSSHGGTWYWKPNSAGVQVQVAPYDAMAFDIGDWSQLKQSTWYAAARKFGFKAGWITPNIAGGNEPWHIIMLDPWRAVPEEDPMAGIETIYTKFNANQAIDKTASYIQHSGTKKYVSLIGLAAGDYLLPGGVLDIELEHPQPKLVIQPDGTAALPSGTFQVQAHAVTVDSTEKVIEDVPLGIEEIIPTSGRTMRQIPLPPRRIGKGQRIRITISATDGLTGKIVSAEFRGSKVPKAPTA